jgi:hypothetical protein
MRLTLSTAIALALQMRLPTALPAQQTQHGDESLTIYSRTNYGGEQATLRDDTPDLKAVGAGDAVASVQVHGGDRWEICEERNYGGRCASLSRSEPDLTRIRWDTRVSSARRIHGVVVSKPGYSLSGIELFTEPSFRGHATTVTESSSTLADSTARVGSVRVRAGTWEVCELARFGGRCALVTGDVANLRSTGLDHIRSLRLHVNLRRSR